MKIRFYWIGTTRDPRLLSLEQEYLERIRKFIPAEIISVSELKKSDPRGRTAQLAKEGRKLLSMIPTGSTVVALDEKGDGPTSPGLAKWLERITSGGTQEVSFIIGGYWGLPDEVLKKAERTLSLGPMTFPHELAMVLLLEQVYRAFTINNGLPYHK